MCAQCGAEGPKDASNAYKTHSQKDIRYYFLLLRKGLKNIELVIFSRVRGNLAPTYFSMLVPLSRQPSQVTRLKKNSSLSSLEESLQH